MAEWEVLTVWCVLTEGFAVLFCRCGDKSFSTIPVWRIKVCMDRQKKTYNEGR